MMKSSESENLTFSLITIIYFFLTLRVSPNIEKCLLFTSTYSYFYIRISLDRCCKKRIFLSDTWVNI